MMQISSVRDALRVVLPTGEQTWLMRACLHDGAVGRQAWHSWHGLVGNPKAVLETDSTGLKGLLPLLHEGIRRNGCGVDKPLRDYLGIARLREELRDELIREICAAVLSALADADVHFIVLRGIALSETVYQHPSLRHCHGIDILVMQHDMGKAARAMAELGLRPVKPGICGPWVVRNSHM